MQVEAILFILYFDGTQRLVIIIDKKVKPSNIYIYIYIYEMGSSYT